MPEHSIGMVVIKPNKKRFNSVSLLVNKAFGKESPQVSKILNLGRLPDVVSTLEHSVILHTEDRQVDCELLGTMYRDKHKEIGPLEWSLIEEIMLGTVRFCLITSNEPQDSLNKALRALKGHCELINQDGCTVFEPYGIRGRYMPKSVLTADREEAVLQAYAKGRIKSQYLVKGCAGGGTTSVPTHYLPDPNGKLLRSMLDNFIHTSDTENETVALYKHLWPRISAQGILGIL